MDAYRFPPETPHSRVIAWFLRMARQRGWVPPERPIAPTTRRHQLMLAVDQRRMRHRDPGGHA